MTWVESMLSQKQKEGFPFRHWKVIAFYLVLYDIVAVNFSYFLDY